VTPWASADELRDDVVATLERFAASPEGQEAAALARELDGPAVLQLVLHDPDVAVHLDVASGTVGDGLADEPAATLELAAADLHDVLLERLGPVEISRLVEERRLSLVGSPEALAASVVLAARVQPHYAASLRERGREALLDTPAPATRVIWQSDEPPPPVFGVRRPWQRPKGAAARASG
jgi:hypothetical protein